VPIHTIDEAWRQATRRGAHSGSRAWLALLLSVLCVIAATPGAGLAAAPESPADTIADRHLSTSRAEAAKNPRSEGDQALVKGWPLYRTQSGQAAFNQTMATLEATQGAAPSAAAFKACAELKCALKLPSINQSGWLPQGRLWVSPGAYVLFVHSPREPRRGKSYRRRGSRSMRYFVFHEFNNSSRNTDAFDTLSAHRGSVFVPLYMTKTLRDARGHRFVAVVQVAPYDVVSIHASNLGSAGPGMEVAKNVADELETLQGLAGIVIASMIKTAEPRLKVVNHRGREGQPMLRAYEAHVAATRGGGKSIALPFTAAPAKRIAVASGQLGDLIVRPGVSPGIPVAQRAFVPPRVVAEPAPPRVPMPVLVRTASLAHPTYIKADVSHVIGRLHRFTNALRGRAEPTLVEPAKPAVRP
jgi:hypothetical protein